MEWEIVIGLETHVQLSTKSKIFSGASTAFGAAPNTQACAIDMALPGVLPVLNKGAVERALRFGLAVGASINRRSIFARKNYFYPDLPKGYQISQYEIPIVQGGAIGIRADGREKTIRLTRAHLEEDAGKSLHEDFHGMSGIDLNRAGTPLLEIVSEPEMRSAAEAVAYAKALHALVRWIGISDANMQEGSFRCDANVSVRRPGAPLGTRREIKNLNSFRFLQQAIEYEAQWQIHTLESGGRVEQATVLFEPESGRTRMMRTKEDAHDYRYFPDPDLLPLEIAQDWLERVRAQLPELPQARCERYQRDYALSAYDAQLLVADRETAEFFESVLDALRAADRPAAAKLAANWINGELAAALNRAELDIARSPLAPGTLAGLLARLLDGTLSSKMAKEVFDALWEGEGSADAVIERRGLKQISDSAAIEGIVDQVLAQNAQQVADYKNGKQKAFNALVGQVMKATQGRANPAQVNDILRRKLAG
ncbi:MAG TPA: Asp-tRNA(Asn)/Glu-tRNA(Gln) amidotransferase subunit GatB [Burkholderiales bacterium]|jgi:aspartyl-tRNA(Asn)/glutamyl-tRNA(Gln) amidotransferase subunit B|nr:Asp-tRNA(Asn)/Glu-tRNA(Gln) amidotransferase subunit GatB [Burkholderiales bacterium]